MVVTLALPFFIALFLASSLSTKEFGLFKQERMGFKKELFNVYKFKSMTGKEDLKDEGIATLSQSRITKFGIFLRKAHLDELPQFFLVFFGKMSLIGPRPELPTILKDIKEEHLDIWTSVKPGLISPASLEYINEEDLLSSATDPAEFYKKQILPKKISMNIEYVTNLSFINDMKIIFNYFKLLI